MKTSPNTSILHLLSVCFFLLTFIFQSKLCIYLLHIYKCYTHTYTEGGSRFTVVSMQNRLLLCYYLLIIVLFSTKKTVNLLYPHLVHVLEKLTKNFFSKNMDVFLKCKAEFIPNKISSGVTEETSLSHPLSLPQAFIQLCQILEEKCFAFTWNICIDLLFHETFSNNSSPLRSIN